MSDEYEAIYGSENRAHKDTPHGWIQWKGTNVCMDLHCPCGFHGHVDVDFFYFYECRCGRRYAVSPFVKLIPLTEGQASGKAFKYSDNHGDVVDGEHVVIGGPPKVLLPPGAL